MRLLHQREDDISRRLVRVLIRLSFEDNVLALHGSSGDVDLESLLLLHRPLALAPLATVLLLVDLARPGTVVADDGLATHHARTNLSNGFDHAVALASIALCRLGLLLPARALAGPTDHLLISSELDGLALVQLFERDLVLVLLVGTLARSWGAPTTSTWRSARATHIESEHLGDDVVQVDVSTARTASGLIKSGHAVGVVEVALVIVAEDVVRFRDFFELDLGLCSLLFRDLVGMVFEGRLSCSTSQRTSAFPRERGRERRSKLTFR